MTTRMEPFWVAAGFAIGVIYGAWAGDSSFPSKGETGMHHILFLAPICFMTGCVVAGSGLAWLLNQMEGVVLRLPIAAVALLIPLALHGKPSLFTIAGALMAAVLMYNDTAKRQRDVDELEEFLNE